MSDLVKLILLNDFFMLHEKTAKSYRSAREQFRGVIPPCTSVYETCRSDIAYAIGDLHGDILAMVACFAACPCMSVEQCHYEGIYTWKIKWKDHCTDSVVICGDLLDRKRMNDQDDDEGNEEELMLVACHILSLQARKQGGLFIRLLGNHEIMNAFGQFSNVTARAMKYYSSCCGGRYNHFKCGGIGALDLCSYGSRVVLKLGNVVFMHAGIASKNDHDIIMKYKKTSHVANEVNKIVYKMMQGDKEAQQDYERVASVFLWDRTQGSHDPDEWCPTPMVFQNLLKQFVDDHGSSELSLVIGHCTQSSGIKSVCNKRVHRIDAAMSRGFDRKNITCQEADHRRPQILKINLRSGDTSIRYSTFSINRANMVCDLN